MDDVTEPWDNYPSITNAGKTGRDDVLLRSKIVCAVYDFYCCAKGGIDLRNTTRDQKYKPIQDITQAEARNALFNARTCIAERIGQYVLFAPCDDDRFSEAFEKPLYQHRPELDAYLQREWGQFCDMLGMSENKKEVFYTPEGFQLDSNHSTIYINPTNCKRPNGNEIGWKIFLDYALAAVGTGSHDDAHVYGFRSLLKPGDIIGASSGSKQLHGLGVILSYCQVSGSLDHRVYEGQVYYAGNNAQIGRAFYPFHVDVAWLRGVAFGKKIKRGNNELYLPGANEGWSMVGGNYKSDIHPNIYKYLLNHTMNSSDSTLDSLTELLKKRRNLVLTGPPGTGKTHLARAIADKMTAVTGFVQFHPSYDYTDFVEGLRPTKPNDDGNIGFERRDGHFKAFCRKACRNTGSNHVFIIDEINRGELSRIFGELFFSLDPDYRGKTNEKNGRSNCVQTQYQQLISKPIENDPDPDPFYYDEETEEGGFYVPKNVYIIGTMNDIDRGVESMDFAIRRRFTWHEVTAASTAKAIIAAADAGFSEAQVNHICDRMQKLNEKIKELLGKDYQLGGAYFAKLEGDREEDFQMLWNLHLHGLLREYLRGRSEAEEMIGDFAEALGVSLNDSADGQR